MLETLDYTIRVGSTPTFLYLDLYLYSAYAAHFVYICNVICLEHVISFKMIYSMLHIHLTIIRRAIITSWVREHKI